MFIDHLRGEAAAHDALRRATATGDWLAASVLTKVEVLAGMRASEEGATRLLLDSLDWIEVDDELAARLCSGQQVFAVPRWSRSGRLRDCCASRTP